MYLWSLLIIVVLALAGCGPQEGATPPVTSGENSSETVEDLSVTFIDDSGREIHLDKPAESVISVYSVHTENIYALGSGETIIGVGMSDKYPEDVLTKTQYSYKDDPELVIAANPDVFLVRTTIERRYPDYIKAIEDAGIVVVNLYCSKYEEFDDYFTRLSMLVGKEEVAATLLEDFHAEIEGIKAKGESIEPKKNAYFESIGKKFRTATPDSFAGTALKIVGVNNVAKDVAYDGTSTVVTYGEEELLAKSAEIEVYIAQLGAMNKTVSIKEIKERPGYMAIKAVKEGNIIIIDEKLISGATMRYVQGLKELQQAVYGGEK